MSFKQWDADGDGTMCREELLKFLQSEQFQELDVLDAGATIDINQVDALFSLIDANGDRTIDMDEFTLFLCYLTSADGDERARILFQLIDENRDGRLSLYELCQFAENLRLVVVPASMSREAFSEFLNFVIGLYTLMAQDSANLGFIDRKGFVRVTRFLLAVVSDNRPVITDALFDLIDANGDQSISADEAILFFRYAANRAQTSLRNDIEKRILNACNRNGRLSRSDFHALVGTSNKKN